MDRKRKDHAPARADASGPPEAIAIIGIGCRFPGGGDSPESLWQMLRDGVDAVSDIPAERAELGALYDPVPGAPGKIASPRGGFLANLDQFDPSFFGISPREATYVDPQQRLLLETAWEAFEDAGLPPDRLKGTSVGVFIGMWTNDYEDLMFEATSDIDLYMTTGGGRYSASGRLSFVFDFHGPSLTVDTACSSSLVTIHLACQSLRSGESAVALAGGVNLILKPWISIGYSRSGMLSPDGRCKFGDASANGYVRSEGVGVVLLKPLARAQADGDGIYALIRGSAVNNDGRSSGLLVAPGVEAQQAMLSEAYRSAGVDPAAVQYLEAHGTGTGVGDPVELEALGAVLGQGRPTDRPCRVGSIKTNIGHTEAASGIAGLIKAALCLRHRQIPKSLHFNVPNPKIPWSTLGIEVQRELGPWPATHGPAFAGVNSFGVTGTNAHVVLEEPPAAVVPAAARATPEQPVHLLCLSAHTPEALRAVARACRELLASEEASALGDLCYAAAVRRSHHEHRLAVVAHAREELGSRLRAFLDGEPGPGVAVGKVPESHTGLAMVFSGQGPQWFAMGRELLGAEPVFRRTLERCDELMRQHAPWSLLSELSVDEARSRLDQTEIMQPAIFALQVGLAALWRSWGITPAAVVGHSVGEVAAAHVAGALSLEDAVRVIVQRGRIMQKATGGGRMVAVALDAEAARAETAPFGGRVALAAINAPASTVLSGEAAAIDQVLETLRGRGVACHPLRVNYAFHSPQMEPFRTELAEALRGIEPRPTVVPMVSTVTGLETSGLDLEPGYWGRNIREAVLFAPAVDTLAGMGQQIFLEVSPHPVLAASVTECLQAGGRTGTVLVSLRRGQQERATLLVALGALYVEGFPVAWSEVLPPPSRPVPLPRYPWQRERYWIETAHGGRGAAATRPTRRGHPLLGGRVSTPLPTFETRVTTDTLPLLSDHRLWGAAVLPLNVYLEMALAAASETLSPAPRALEDVTVQQPLPVPDTGSRTLQIVLSHGGGFEVFGHEATADDGADAWTPLVSGRLAVAGASGNRLPLAEVRQRCRAPRSGAEFYEELRQRGFGFGPATEAIDRLWRGEGEALASLRLPDVALPGSERYAVQPAWLMGAFLVAWAAVPTEPPAGQAYFPARLDRFRVLGPSPARAFGHARLRSVDHAGLSMDLTLCDEAGQVIAEAAGVVFKLAGREMLGEAGPQADGWLYKVNWVPRPHPAAAALGAALDLPGPKSIAKSVVSGEFERARQSGVVERYAEVLSKLEALSAASAAEALRRLGFDFRVGQAFSTDGLAEQLRIAPAHRRLFSRLLEMLEEEGRLLRTETGWAVRLRPEPIDAEREWLALRAAYSEFDAEISLVARCAPVLHDVLRGTREPLDLLFPGGSFALTERLYQDSPGFSLYNAFVKESIAEAVRALPARGTLRILEIGAGTGGTTTHVLPVLPGERTEYVFTDVSPLFATRAQEKFARYPFVRYALLDIEQDPEAQGLAARSFDIVLAANVLHATRDLRQTLARVRQLLAPGGLLLLFEVTARHRWIDLTFGLTEGWWRFSDAALRPSYPLLSRSRWLELLAEAGFSEAAALPRKDEGGVETRQAVLLAREPGATKPRGTWLIFADQGGVGRTLAARLRERGERSLLLRPTGAAAMPDELRLDPERREDAERVLSEAAREASLRGVVHLWGLDANEPGPQAEALLAEQRALCGGVVHLAQALATGEPGARLFMATRGAVQVEAGPIALAQAALWGLGRGIALEHPETWGAIVDLDPASSAEEAASRLLHEIDHPEAENQIAYRDTDRLVPRLERASIPRLEQPRPWRSDRAYLVTGGLGGLGLKLAFWLVKRGARHLVLLGRTPLPPREAWAALPPGGEAACRVSAIQAIEALGATVLTEAGDVSDAAAMTALFSRFGTSEPALAGVFHAAVDLTLCSLRDLDLTGLTAMLRPKVSGAWILHELTRGLELDMFVLFSSMASVLGAVGQAHYAAANRFLDALAHHRRSLGLPGLSVNWGAWDEIRPLSGAQRERVARSGLREMAPERALAHLADLLDARVAQMAVASVDWRTLRSAYEARRPQPFLEHLGSEPLKTASSTAAAHAAKPVCVARLQQLELRERLDLLEEHVAGEVARVLGLSATGTIDRRRGFFQMGMDSLTSAELRRRLESGLGRPLPSTLAFNYPSVEALARYLADVVFAAEPGAKAEPEAASREATRPAEPTAVHADMSEDELAERLSAKLRGLR